MEDEIIKLIKKSKRKSDLYSIPIDIIPDATVTNFIQTNRYKKPKIILFCNICYGFGDIIFCMKIFWYIKKWYNITPTIMTTIPDFFIKNGVKTKFYGLREPGGDVECNSVYNMKIHSVDDKGKLLKRTKVKEEYDLIFVTPWIGTDFEPKHSIMKRYFPYSNRFNTFLFSTYNTNEPEKYDFPTGVGKGLYGILLTDSTKKSKPDNLKNPFIMTHVSYYHEVDVNKCFNNFVLLMCKKYHKSIPKLDIISPKVILDEPEYLVKLIKQIVKKGYYKNVKIIEKGDSTTDSTTNSTLYLRFDVLPLGFNEYVNLLNYSLPDILLTGNQSVSDVISCCKNFNIYYQIMPWERKLAYNLNKVLNSPNNYLRKKNEACGLEKMSIGQKTNLKVISDNYDFRVLGKQKIDKLILFTNYKNNNVIKKYMEIVVHSNKKETVLKKFMKWLKNK